MKLEDANERYFKWKETASEDDKKLRDRLYELGDYFLDMLFDENSPAGDMIRCQVNTKSKGGCEEGHDGWQDDVTPLPDEITCFTYNYFDTRVGSLEGYGGYFDEKEGVLCISEENAENDSVILHEMLHLHEYVLNGLPLFYHDVLLWVLYNGLKKKIKDLDKVVSGHAHILVQQSIYHKGGAA